MCVSEGQSVCVCACVRVCVCVHARACVIASECVNVYACEYGGHLRHVPVRDVAVK